MPASPDRADWIPPRVRTVVGVSLLFICLNIFDCWATFQALDMDGRESNVLVAAALNLGPRFFVAWKLAGAGVVTLILALFSRRSQSAWRILRTVTVCFGLISLYYLCSFVFIWVCIQHP